jgi:hypothetical protein
MVVIGDDSLEELCGFLLQVQELRTALALKVSALLNETKKSFDSPTKAAPQKSQAISTGKRGVNKK